MATTPILKKVKVKRTAYTFHVTPQNLRQYIIDCVNMGSASVLYQDPHIPTAFYDEGILVEAAIGEAIGESAQAPTTTNKNEILDKAKAGERWLNSYSDKVEEIANTNANRTTREEAATNIGLSFLTPQKLKSHKKGTPETPKVVAENVGTGKVKCKIVNGVDYQPSETTYIVVEKNMGATISISNGQLEVALSVIGHVIVKVASKKGKHTQFSGLKPGVDYAIYAYAQNGKNQISELSTPKYVKG